jgi:hypothetical protein
VTQRNPSYRHQRQQSNSRPQRHRCIQTGSHESPSELPWWAPDTAAVLAVALLVVLLLAALVPEQSIFERSSSC